MHTFTQDLRFWEVVFYFIFPLVVTFFVVRISSIFLKKNDELEAIPVTLPERSHFILGHAAVIGTDLISGLRTLCVDSSVVDGLSRFYLVNNLAVSVTKAEHVKLALSSSNYRSRIPLITIHTEMLLGKKSLPALMKNEWKLTRKLATKAFHWEYLKSMVTDLNTVMNIFTNSFANKNGQIVDMWPILKCITLDIIGISAFGYNFKGSETLISSPVAEAFEYILEESTVRQFQKPLDPRSYFYALPTKENRKFNEASRIIRGTISNIIRLRKEAPPGVSEQHHDLLKYFLDAHEEDGVAADTEALIDNLMAMLFGGYDTSSITLTYAIYMMSQHHDIELKVRKEVMDVLGPKGNPTYEDLTSRLPYCTAVINEVLRLYPPAPVTTRTLVEPLKIPVDLRTHKDLSKREDKTAYATLPVGTMMYIPIWWIHRSPDNFSDPELFDPERFFDENRSKQIHRFAHIPFSGGARDCVGRRFAMLELVGVFAMIMQNFSFEALPGYVLQTEASGVVQKPKGGMPLKVLLVQ